MHLKEGGEVLCQRTLVAKMHDSIYIAEIIISYCHFCYVWPWITGPVLLFLISLLLYAENLHARFFIVLITAVISLIISFNLFSVSTFHTSKRLQPDGKIQSDTI